MNPPQGFSPHTLVILLTQLVRQVIKTGASFPAFRGEAIYPIKSGRRKRDKSETFVSNRLPHSPRPNSVLGE